MAAPVSPLLLRGMGSQPALVTGGFLTSVAEVIKKVIRRAGRSLGDLADKFPDIYRVKAMLLSVNRRELTDPRSKLLITEVYAEDPAKVIISDVTTTSVKSTPYRIHISDIKVKKGGR
jgi:hypothetical protein